MEAKESFERFKEGLKKAASRARELGIAQRNNDWNTLAFRIDDLARQGEIIYFRRALSHQAALQMLSARETKTNEDLNG